MRWAPIAVRIQPRIDAEKAAPFFIGPGSLYDGALLHAQQNSVFIRVHSRLSSCIRGQDGAANFAEADTVIVALCISSKDYRVAVL
jgi:hypothetical protein